VLNQIRVDDRVVKEVVDGIIHVAVHVVVGPGLQVSSDAGTLQKRPSARCLPPGAVLQEVGVIRPRPGLQLDEVRH
jgi:hypothetical protein